MTDYSKASIYKIVCEDGHFYVGSTVLSINTRFAQHRRSVENGVNSKVYRHIRECGIGKASIKLVATNLGITTRDELLRIEDEYIREGLRSKKCLNRNKPRATSEERTARAIQHRRMWKALNRSTIVGDENVAQRVREYYREHRRLPRVRRPKGDPEELLECECGFNVMRAQLGGHQKTREHFRELMRWTRLRHILQHVDLVKKDRPSLWEI